LVSNVGSNSSNVRFNKPNDTKLIKTAQYQQLLCWVP